MIFGVVLGTVFVVAHCRVAFGVVFGVVLHVISA